MKELLFSVLEVKKGEKLITREEKDKICCIYGGKDEQRQRKFFLLATILSYYIRVIKHASIPKYVFCM
jgi:hypothetical protein